MLDAILPGEADKFNNYSCFCQILKYGDCFKVDVKYKSISSIFMQ